ncbi:MAG TPA: branched-chain amino acid ABC transporter permease [Mycobacteriales bacterium]|nr:branched-chain amino acid ABC transporter permease [Mycobacteriales bacterium]
MSAGAVAIGSRVRPSALDLVPRAIAWLALAGVVAVCAGTGPTVADYATLAAIYVVVGLSLNVIIGYTGQLSLGHQGLVGSGALLAAYTSTAHNAPFVVALLFGALAGGICALVVGFVALRISGLYLSLVTLVFGVTLQQSLFQVNALTGGGAGEPANRPTFLRDNWRFFLVCTAIAIATIYLDFRLTRSKAGRAMLAIKSDERVAASMGINVVGYKLFAFVLSGLLAGLAGATLAFSSQQFTGSDYSFNLAILFVLMTVVGGAGSRAGVIVGSVFFALLGSLLPTLRPFVWFANLFPTQTAANIRQFGPGFIGALLLLLTLTFNSGGIAQQIAPVMRWLTGGPFKEAEHASGS